MIDNYFDDMAIGDTWISEGRTITETDIIMFSSLSGDWFPLHSNIEYAAKTPYKQRIAQGMLILSISTGLMNFKPDIVVAFYGMDRVRFTAPTFIGDTIQVYSKVLELKEHDEFTGVITVLQEIKNQHQEIVAVVNIKLLINRK